MKKIYFLFLLLTFSPLLYAQQTAKIVKGDVLVRMYVEEQLPELIDQLQKVDGQATRLRVKRQLSKPLNIWQLEFDDNAISHERMLDACRALPAVQAAQLNRQLEPRLIPNDPNYGLQWQYDNPGGSTALADADIDADSAWNVTTGGLTAIGDTIVVCVIDDGLDLTHQDMAPNRWYNYNEIPNNGIDDDNNGYVDDYEGWNAYDNNGNISPSSFSGGHGSPVSGIIGAKGNNGIGVTGVNWNVKIMVVVGGGNEADAIAAYDYPLTMRKLYNQTSGQKGAFIVATNASWGVNNILASNFPILCALYDSLGTAGVLNVAATANTNSDIDVVGDLPTHCDSDYLIAVTNTTDADQKLTSAGYGEVSIDLGAPGEGTYTVASPNTYGTFGGTSGASPHVTGTVGLIYSTPCLQLAYAARTQPAATALLVKDFIMQGVDTLPQLDSLTVSNGRLNLNNSVQLAMQSNCSLTGCYAPYGLVSSVNGGTNMTISWVGVAAAQSGYLLRYREQGTTSWIDTVTADTFFSISNLQTCTFYELQVAADCDTSIGNYSNLLTAKTGDCCNAPPLVTSDSIGINFVILSWDSNPIAASYTLEYRPMGDTSWQSLVTSDTFFTLTGLDTCARYELRIQSTCAINVNNNYSPLLVFKTKGCGACQDLIYCIATAGDASYEWISEVVIDTVFANSSGSSSGYTAFFNSSAVLYRGRGYPIALTLDKSASSTPNWAWKIWIDFNQDGLLDDQTELAYSSAPITTAGNLTTNAILFLPSTAMLGSTRMRVALKWGSSAAAPCGTFSYGEVEDYCINITDDPSPVAPLPSGKTVLRVFPNPVQTQAQLQINTIKTQKMRLRVFDVRGVELHQQSLSVQATSPTLYQWDTQDWPAGIYVLQLIDEDGKRWIKKFKK